MKILIADDHPLNLKLLRAQLEAEGVTVLEAGDGEQALAVLEREPVDAIISDVLMPKMDGYQLCYALHKNGRFQSIPCILYSNTFASDSSRLLALGFGADLFLKKPAPPEMILTALHEVMQKKRQQTREAAEASTVQHLKETRPYSEHLIRELESQNTELEELKNQLLEVNNKLLIRTKKLEELEVELRKTNAELDRRVRLRTVQLEAANQELESFSYSVSHDLRAPLRAINGFSQRVLDKTAGALEEVNRSDLQRVVAATHEMTQLIDALLALARVTRTEIVRRPVNLSVLARTVLDELKRVGSERPTEIVIQPDLTVEADARLIQIALTNLLGNAWKFTRKTACPRIEFTAREVDGQQAYLVRDNGAGFDMAYADKLFGAFQRLHSREDFEGTGIGLATVQRIIRRHGGKVWAESALQQGSTFYFTLGGNASDPATS